MSDLNLDPERLTMLDDYGHKNVIIPAEVKGFFRNYRNYFYSFLVLFFLLLPWTEINGVQTVLLDLPNRKFSIFGITFWAHDAPMIFFVLAFFTLGLAFVTSVWGRIWCGWACPQTVFIDLIYRNIEKWIEGNYLQRRELNKQELNLNKLFKKLSKWIAFFFVSSLIAHAFAAYFVGSKELTQWIISGDINTHWSTFLVISFITAVLLFDFGWFREQFCIIMCPYGRFQSVLMDSGSLAVLYNTERGEPRKGLLKTTNDQTLNSTENKKQGDCISCQRCVQVCPTGIDIRKGLQLECIACTACIDACDEIMVKVNKPKELISYSTISGKKNKVTSLRSLAYLILIGLCGIGLTYLIATRHEIDIAFLRAKDSPYQLIQSDQVSNHFKLHIKNQSFEKKIIRIKIPPNYQNLNLEIKSPESPVVIDSGGSKTVHIFVLFNKINLNEKGELKTEFDFYIENSKTKITKEATLVGPNKEIK